MRKGEDPAGVFSALHRRGSIVIHPSDSERTAALADVGAAGDLVVADTREQVAGLNAAIRAQRRADRPTGDSMVTARGERLGLGDRVATRRNDPGLGVVNRQIWTVSGIGEDGSLVLHARGRDLEGRTRPGSSSSPTPSRSTAPRARPSTELTSPSGTPPGPRRRTSR